MAKPFFSVLVPTRNRPGLLAYGLQSLAAQSFGDFEVVVSDNFTTHSCREVFNTFADRRFRYVRPPKPLAMHDNWEFALRHARGEYVTVLIDKTLLHTRALEITRAELERERLDVASWWNECYAPIDEGSGYDRGFYNPQFQPQPVHHFDPRAELARHFRFETRVGLEGVKYHWGKICFGAWSQDLLKRIRHRAGRVFHPLSADYSSTLLALAFANSASDLGRPLTLSILTSVSNGMTCARHPEAMARFCGDHDPTGRIFAELPIPHLYSSTHNVLAFDYAQLLPTLRNVYPGLALNIPNLARRCAEDLREVEWPSDQFKAEQRFILQEILGPADTSATLDTPTDTTANLSPEQIRDIYERVYHKFDSPFAAASFAQQHYDSQLPPRTMPLRPTRRAGWLSLFGM